MGKRTIIACAAVFFCIAILSLGCKKNCASTACHNYGYNTALGFAISQSEVCNNGHCFCPNGLEGDSCKTFSINKFVQPTQSWSASDGCSGFGNTYYVTFSTTTSNYSIFYINGLFGGGATVEADILSNTSHQGVDIRIPPQNTPSGQIISGNGTYRSNGSLGTINLILDYVPNSNGQETECTIVLSQQ